MDVSKFFLSKLKIIKSGLTGQTLLEIVVGVGLVSMVLVAMVSAITYSLANIQQAKSKAEATQYAQDAIEWLRNQRDNLGWTGFSTHAGNTYCLNDLNWSTPTNCSGFTLKNIYKREVTLIADSADKITAALNMQWQRGTQTKTVAVTTVYTNWYAGPYFPSPTPSPLPTPSTPPAEWYLAGVGQRCDVYCDSLGLTYDCDTSQWNDDNYCNIQESLLYVEGFSCTGCGSSSHNSAPRLDTITNTCYYRVLMPQMCNEFETNYRRLCHCISIGGE